MTTASDTGFGIADIERLLPHRYPFLLVDRVLAWVPNESITAVKNVSINEPFFQGHFPGAPVMPGMLILEALAQTGGVLIAKSLQEPLGDRLFMFTGVEKARFRRPVVPGDQLIPPVLGHQAAHASVQDARGGHGGRASGGRSRTEARPSWTRPAWP